ncbi:DoxX family protein [Amycolatopsis australiensis]|uniref:DoxX-like family protein n=1 Tax=Amycolatopsis australiensis TaxID=546364 RepID=A0A1K1T5E4_9PSEU|nr:DoxX family protein [Amycolatopsis australiensis]SFW91269.1 DoxX-like family protein [Amycolatopsis australiensis]
MHTAVIVTTIVLNAAIGLADLAKAKFVLATSAAVDVPPGWLPVLGTLKLAGAAGLLLGLLGVQPLGIAAGIGLVLFYVGAIVAHVKARKYATGAAPLLFLGLAVAAVL